MSDEYRQLTALLDRVRRRLLAMTAMRAWTRTAAALAVVSLAALLIDRLLSPEGPALIALWSAVGVVSVACGGVIVAALRRTPGQHQIARFVEERCPEMEDALVTAMAERERNPSHPMLAA